MNRRREQSRDDRGDEEREKYRSCCEDWGEIALGYVEAMKATCDLSEKQDKSA
ncbi:MAG: hypothetical protein JMJ93_03425 [Synergistaceae bacterium]|jgi:hypothetical protein|nr:hypothetical protein [Synergistaceae bacterium]